MATPRHPTAQRRTEIADAALRVVAGKGIASLTMATLAAELGVTAGALFRHFPSRDAILVAVAARVEELLLAPFPGDELSAVDRLRQLMRQRSRAIESHAGVAALMFSEQFALALPPEAAATLRKIVRETRGFVVRTLAEGQKRGEVRGDAAAEDLAPIVMGTMQAMAFFAAGATSAHVMKRPEKVWKALELLLAPSEKES